jgi:hypothetical protein
LYRFSRKRITHILTEKTGLYGLAAEAGGKSRFFQRLACSHASDRYADGDFETSRAGDAIGLNSGYLRLSADLIHLHACTSHKPLPALYPCQNINPAKPCHIDTHLIYYYL